MDGLQIRDVRADGIEYLDDEGQLQFIDFLVCHENLLKELFSPDKREEERDFRAVGARVTIAEPGTDGQYGYVYFYTNPPIVFYFTEADYWQVLGEMRKLGWRTYDMS